MQAGKLDRLITIQELVTGRDAAGGVTKTWVDFAADIWGGVMYLSGIETIKADAPVAVRKCSWEIRYLPGVVETMRIVETNEEGTTYFDIKNVQPRGRRRQLFLVCEQGLNNG